jgi:uncharacterized membrane protein
MSRPVRILGVLLAVSLAINIFVLGFAAARAWQRPGGPRAALGRDAPAPLFHADRILAGTEPGKLQWLSHEQKRELVPRFKALRRARVDAEEALRKEPFDRPAFEQALERVRSETINVQTALHGLLAGLADGMTPPQRAELARLNWQDTGRHRDHRQGRGKHRRQGPDRAVEAPGRDAAP